MQKINIKELLKMQRDNTNIRPLHFILGNKALNKLEEIKNIPMDTVTFHPQFNGSDELDFSVYKDKDNHTKELWDKIVDFKSLYVKEYNEWFEISVTVDESENNIKKTIKAISLCEAELGQVILYNIEINTKDDIAREDYTEPTVIWDENKPQRSLLHRVFEKAPNYTIKHVDSTLKDIQRTFSIDGTSIYDFLSNTLAQEIGCIFIFDSNERGVYVYDIETCCLDCGYRSEDSFDVCPECNSKNIKAAYGKDTSIFIDKKNLGSDITLTSNTDSVKNCFRVIGGDDLINATIKNVNPNGSNYIYYFNEDALSDMPQELQNKINSYNNLMNEYMTTKSFTIESSLVEQYNQIISYIKTYYSDATYTEIQNSYTGWNNIVSVYYDTIDLYSYLNNSMMPTWKQQEKTAESQLALLTTQNLSPISVTDVSNISIFTANNAVLAMAKALVDTSMYKVEIIDKSSSLTSQRWTGRFKLTSYSDNEDTAQNTSDIIVEINDDFISYTNQRVDKAMAKINDQGLLDLYKIDSLDKFKDELHKHSAARLTSYESAYQSAIDILIQQGVASDSSDLHDSIYIPYYNKLIAIQTELSYRNTQVDTITGIQKFLSDMIDKVHSETDFQKYIGTDLWNIFVSYKREDSYSNDNYVSDGLSNSELIDKANELITVSKKELIKSGEKQFTISGTLQNLLLILDNKGNRVFEPILDDFTLGNFIRCKIDKKLYIMRLADITINYSDLTKLSVTFSDVYRKGTPTVNKVTEILSKAQSMSTSYSSTVKQAEQGEKANLTFDKIQKEGLDSALYNIRNSNSTAVFDDHGLLIRSYDDILDDYTDEQLRASHNEIIFTTSNWKSAVTAVGKQKYTLNGITYEEYGVNAQFCISSKIISGDLYSANYTADSSGNCTAGTHINLNNGNFVFAGGKLKYIDNELSISGKITAKSGEIGKWKIMSDENGGAIYRDFEQYRAWIQPPANKNTWVYSCQEAINGTYYGNWYVTASGYMYGNNVNIRGIINATTITANEGILGGWNLGAKSIYSSYNNGETIYNISLNKVEKTTTHVLQITKEKNNVYEYPMYIDAIGAIVTNTEMISGWDNTSISTTATIQGGEIKMRDNTNTVHTDYEPAGIFGVDERDGITKFCCVTAPKKDGDQGLYLYGAAGLEAKFVRDGIELWYQPNDQKYTKIGKGYLYIDNGGSGHFGDCALSVIGGISTTGISVMHSNNDGTYKQYGCVLNRSITKNNQNIFCDWDGTYMRIYIDDTIIASYYYNPDGSSRWM